MPTWSPMTMPLRRAGLACLALLPLFAACAAPGPADYAALLAAPAPPLPSESSLTEDSFIAADGAHLPLRIWRPKGEAKAIILALHGFNDYSNAFAGVGAAMAERGIATYAYDQRGFGTAPLHGRWVGQRQLAADLVTASRLLRRRYPGVPLYLLGESMGGSVIAVALAGPARPEADGVILAAPAVWGRETMSVVQRLALWAAVRVAPGMTLTGRGVVAVRPSDNIAMLRALSADPLIVKETRIDAIYGLVDLMDAALAAAPKIDVPLLYLYGERDQLVPKEPTRQMIDHLQAMAGGRLRIAWYVDGYHMLLRDLDSAVVIGDIAGWIANRQASLPSGAEHYATAMLGPRGFAKLATPPAALPGTATP